MKRPGYYVEGKPFHNNFHQARARAAFLSKEYGRDIPIMLLEHPRHGEAPEPYEVTRIHNVSRNVA